jgi:protein-disulfide isomerase
MTQELKVIVGIAVASVLLLLVGIFFFNTSEQNVQQALADPATLVKPFNHTITSGTAKVTVVEFADFQCPACRAAHPGLKQIISDYKTSVTYVYRHFPLPQHTNAVPAAKAAEAAAKQQKDAFWKMADILYDRQTEWSQSSNPEQLFSGYAKELGLDVSQFEEAMKSNEFDERIQADMNDGNKIGVNSTPSIFINGKKLLTAPTYENIKNMIAEELK